MSRFRWLWTLVLPIVALACLRLGVSWSFEAPQTIDELGYLSVARYLATGDGLIEAQGRPAYKVGWSLVLAPFLWIDSGPYATFRLAQLVNCLLLCGFYLLAWSLVGRLQDMPEGERVLIASCVSAYPAVSLYSATGLAESLFATAFLGLVVLAHRWFTTARQKPGWSLATGLVAGSLYVIHERGLVPLVALLSMISLATLDTYRKRPDKSAPGGSLSMLAWCWLGATLAVVTFEILVEIPGTRYERSTEIEGALQAAVGRPHYLFRALLAQIWYLTVATGGVLTLEPVSSATAPWRGMGGRQGWWWFLQLSLVGTVLLTVFYLAREPEPTLGTMIYGRYVEGVLSPVLLLALIAMRRWQRSSSDALSRSQLLSRQLIALTAIAIPTLALVRTWHPSQGGILSLNSAGVALLATPPVGWSLLGSSALAVSICLLVAASFRFDFKLGMFGLLLFFVAGTLRISVLLQPWADDIADSRQLASGVRRLAEHAASPAAATARTKTVVFDGELEKGRQIPFYLYNLEYWLAEFDFVEHDPASPFLVTIGLRPQRAGPGDRLTAVENVNRHLAGAPIGLWIRPGDLQQRAAERGLLFPPGFPSRYDKDALAASSELLLPADFPRSVSPGSDLRLDVAILHQGSAPWPSEKALRQQRFSVRFDVIFRRADKTRASRRLQLPLARTLYRGESIELPIEIQTPHAIGDYLFEVRIFQETGGNNPVRVLMSEPIRVTVDPDSQGATGV